MKNKLTGTKGEDLAVAHLERLGYEIVERNYRYSYGEIDIIGILNNELLVFFEVKSRRGNAYGEPETFVSRKQEKMIIKAAENYIFAINWLKDVRFDIISITGSEVLHIEDAFY